MSTTNNPPPITHADWNALLAARNEAWTRAEVAERNLDRCRDTLNRLYNALEDGNLMDAPDWINETLAAMEGGK
jgi:hypothetical protein